MESDSLLASLSADGEIQAVTCVANLPTGGLQKLAYIYLGLHQIPKLVHLLPSPPTLNKTTGRLLAVTAQPHWQTHLSTCEMITPPQAPISECQTH